MANEEAPQAGLWIAERPGGKPTLLEAEIAAAVARMVPGADAGMLPREAWGDAESVPAGARAVKADGTVAVYWIDGAASVGARFGRWLEDARRLPWRDARGMSALLSDVGADVGLVEQYLAKGRHRANVRRLADAFVAQAGVRFVPAAGCATAHEAPARPR